MRRLAAIALVALLASSCAVVEVRGPSPLTFGEHMRLGAIYEAQGSYELAMREYESALDMEPRDANASFALGNACLGLKDHARAERHYRRAIELSASVPEYHNNLGWLLMEKGDIKGSLASVAEAIRLSSPEAAYIYLDTLGVVQTSAGDYKAAEESLLRAAASVPRERSGALVEIYGHLRDLYTKAAEAEKAATVDEKLRLFNPPAKEGL